MENSFDGLLSFDAGLLQRATKRVSIDVLLMYTRQRHMLTLRGTVRVRVESVSLFSKREPQSTLWRTRFADLDYWGIMMAHIMRD